MLNVELKNIVCTNCASSDVICKNGIYTCNYCQSKFEKKQIDSKMFINLGIANQERQCANFEKAKNLYEQIIKDFPDEDLTDVYWGLFLCEQRVLFEEDGNGENFPSFFRITQNLKVEDSQCFGKALSYALKHNTDRLETFNYLADKIEDARKMYFDIKTKTEPFDVFICFKNTDKDGNYTNDRQLAMDIYNEFSNKYNIFFSEKTLKDIKSSYRQYEPNIYYGLYTAKVMLLICSKKEYLESKWLKNEWSRFTQINKQGENNKCIIPIFTDGFNPEDLPESLWHNQGIFDDRKLISTLETTLQNITNPVDKLEELRKEQEKQREELKKAQEMQRLEQERLLNEKLEALRNQNLGNNVNLDNMIKRGFQYLDDEEWDNAINQVEKIFDVDVTVAQGYIIKMMIEYKLKTLSDFNKLDISAFENKNYKNALKYASEDYKQELIELKNKAISINTNNKEESDNKEILNISSKPLYTRNGNSITFGSYPQTKVIDKYLIKALNKITKKLPTPKNSHYWTDYGYYVGGDIESYMWYIDLEYDNNKYRGVYFTKFRPKFTTDYFITDTSQKNEYFKKTIYWFKYEPITWTVKEELKGCATIVCDMILDSQDFNYTTNNKTINGKSIYANNYQHSHIRSWLNDMFYNTAFNKLEQELIQITTVDNSLLSTEYLENKYICNDTNDKIYLLSKKELTTYFEDNLQRQKQSSDYAKCQGLTGCWWLRSPSYYNSYNTLSIGSNGNITNGSYVSFSSSGVLPVLRIKL